MAPPTAQTTENRRYWGRIGGLRAHALHGPDVMLSAARQGFRDRFTKLVDPEGLLDPVEREVRTDRLQRAHMLELAAKSATARRRGAPDKKIPPASVSPGGIVAEGHGNGHPPIR